MGEVMTIDEIRRRYDSEWVLIEDPDVSEQMEVLGGKVACHSKDRDEVYGKAIELRLANSATLYTGSIPEDTAVVL
ncbi:MAG: hypothetical protein AMXMBFR13_39050 [Phycisphaerae bacterium]